MTGEFRAPDLGVYVHWPYCARICPYCDFNVVRDRGRVGEQAALKDAIAADLSRQAVRTGKRRLVSIFFGGGTPSLMDPDWVGEIIALCRGLWVAADDLEVTLEANPTDAEADRFAGFADAGVGRLSLGVQALDDEALRFLGRNHNVAEARRAAALAARLFPRLSVDMIYARPDQTAAAWAAELAQAVALGAEHISPYQLTIERQTAFGRAAARGALIPPDQDLGALLFETTQSVLEAAGFDAYEVSNHARGPAARSRHNLVYWQGWDYVGVGPGAHGRLTLGGVRHALETPRKIADYAAGVQALDEALSPMAAAEERLLSGLRITDGVAFADLRALALTPESPAVVDAVDQGLVAPDALRLRATPAGRLVLDRLTTSLIV